jgi:hypothetical protein
MGCIAVAQSAIAYDLGHNPMILFPNEWSADFIGQTCSKVQLSNLPIERKKN